MLIEALLSLQVISHLNQCLQPIYLLDPLISFEEKEEIEMGCFQAVSLYEKYGDQLEQQVPLDPTVISYDELRYLTVLHHGYDGFVHIGELIVNACVADEVLQIFKELYLMGYPIEKMRVMSCYGGSDELSMEDNNSSAFNFRYMTDGGQIFKELYLMGYPIEKMRVMSCYGGSDELSMEDNNSSAFNFRYMTDGGNLSYHAYGLAIDLNPKVNPYIKEELVLPVNGKEYVNRNQCVLGMIKKDDAVYQLFKRYGWTWGGDWTSLKDYQHFEKPQ